MNVYINKLEEALEKFGTYQYYDKGSDEIMDLNSLLREARKASCVELSKDMNELFAHEHGRELYMDLYTDLIENEMHPEVDELYGLIEDPFKNQTPKKIEIKTEDFYPPLGEIF